MRKASRNSPKKLEGATKKGKKVYKFLDEQVTLAEENLKTAVSTLQQLYSYGIVHPKYRNLVALCTFHEYLETGRCSALEGPDGAYNLYESELRTEIIIGHLEQIESKLDTIIDNQREICATLRSIDQSLANIDAKTTKAIDLLGSIDTNSKATAIAAETNSYYTEKNNRMLDALGFLVALK